MSEFAEYTVAHIGTVIAHDSGHYIVRLADGRVVGYAAPSGNPSEAHAASDIADALIDLTPRKAALRVRAKQRRRETEEGGITLANGTPIATDRESQAMLDGTLSLASLSGYGSQFSTRWKGEDGVFREVSQSDLIAAALAVGLHVQACFNREADFCDAITAAETAAQLDALAAEIDAFEI